MAYTILHISDLHRSPEHPIGNDELLSTLIADRDRYTKEDPAVPAPDAIIVSGDIVQGAGPDASDPEASIREQYTVASDFLTRLAEQLVPRPVDRCKYTRLKDKIGGRQEQAPSA